MNAKLNKNSERSREELLAGLASIVVKKRDISLRPHPNALAAKGDIEGLQQLIEEGVSVDTPSPSGATPLTVAAKHGQLEVVKFLMQFSAQGKAAALLAAIATNQTTIVDFLLGS